MDSKVELSNIARDFLKEALDTGKTVIIAMSSGQRYHGRIRAVDSGSVLMDLILAKDTTTPILLFTAYIAAVAYVAGE